MVKIKPAYRKIIFELYLIGSSTRHIMLKVISFFIYVTFTHPLVIYRVDKGIETVLMHIHFQRFKIAALITHISLMCTNHFTNWLWILLFYYLNNRNIQNKISIITLLCSIILFKYLERKNATLTWIGYNEKFLLGIWYGCVFWVHMLCWICARCPNNNRIPSWWRVSMSRLCLAYTVSLKG